MRKLPDEDQAVRLAGGMVTRSCRRLRNTKKQRRGTEAAGRPACAAVLGKNDNCLPAFAIAGVVVEFVGHFPHELPCPPGVRIAQRRIVLDGFRYRRADVLPVHLAVEHGVVAIEGVFRLRPHPPTMAEMEA